MGLLDGDLKEVFGSVFAPLLLDATITKVTLTPDGEGGMSESTETASAKGMVEKYSAFERQRDGIPMTDVKLIVLQKDVALIPDLDSEITIRDQLYSIQAISEDPAEAAWTLQGRPIRTGDTAGPVSITADAAGAAEAGTPRLRLVVDNTVGAVASVGGPGQSALVGAEVSGIAAVGQPRRTVSISGEVSGSADAGTPDVSGEFSGDASGVAEVGAPRTEIRVAAEASGIVEAGAPDSEVAVDAEAGAVADAAAGIGVAIEINSPALGIAEAGAAEVSGEFNATATGVGGVGAPQREVRTSADAGSVGDAGAVTRSIGLSAEAIGTADAGAPTRSVGLEVDASGVVKAGAGVRNAVVVSADSAAVADADAGVSVTAAEEPWTPDMLSSVTLDLWLDASDAASITKDGSDLVSQWSDKSGNTNHATQATGSLQPEYSAADVNLNGNPSIAPLDSADYLQLGSTALATFWALETSGANRGFSLWGASSFVSGAFPWSGIIAGIWDDTVNGGGDVHWETGTQLTDTTPESSPTPANPGAIFMAGYVASGGSSGWGRILSEDTPNRLFQRSAGGRDFDGSVGEIIVCTGTLSTDERQRLEGYMAWKWGFEADLPSGHPYESAAPTAGVDGEVSVNGDAHGVADVGTTIDVVGAPASGPEVVWTATLYGSGLYDWSGQDYQEGDVIVAFSLGFWTNTVPGGNASVVYDDWVLGYTNGSNGNATTLSYWIIDAGNIGTTTYRHGNGAADAVIFCIRGADLTQFANSVNGDGYNEIDDASIIAAASVAGTLDTGSISVGTADSTVLSFGGYRDPSLTYTAPTGYTLDQNAGGTNSALALAHKSGVGVGTEDPGAFGHTTLSGGVGYTMAIAPAA